MHKARYALLISLALAGACSDLPGKDDPRDYHEDDKGICRGDYISCSDRTLSQCNGGCTVTTECHDPMLETCASIRSPDACDSNSLCRWSSTVCELKHSQACSINHSQTACLNDTFQDCVWGSACDGSPDLCLFFETQAECTASFGCTWTPE